MRMGSAKGSNGRVCHTQTVCGFIPLVKVYFDKNIKRMTTQVVLSLIIL